MSSSIWDAIALPQNDDHDAEPFFPGFYEPEYTDDLPVDPEEAPAPVVAKPTVEIATGVDALRQPSLEDEVNSAMAPAVADARAAGQIPDEWDITDYLATGNDSAAAAKLADSAVAPLVVMARGYETIHEEHLADATKRYALPRKTNAQGKRIAEAITRGDILIMPWFTHDDVVLAERSLRQPKPVTIQFRPAKPDVNEKGKEIKYEFVGGQKTPIGMHPGFPTSWIDTTPVVLIAEGLLKGDSALSAYLLANGATRADLAWTDADSTGDRDADVLTARRRLADLLEKIDPDNRVLILTIGGVDNWKNNAEWRTIEMKGRTTWIGIDGDVSTNPNVYRAATEMWDFLAEKKKTTPMLIAPTVKASDGEKKIGIDDFLSKYGSWNDLVAMLATKLPQRPQGTDVEFIGTYRANRDCGVTEHCKGEPDPYNPDSPPIRGRWEPVLPFCVIVTALYNLIDDLNGGQIVQVADVEVSVSTPFGVRRTEGTTLPVGLLRNPPELLERIGATPPAWGADRREWPIVYAATTGHMDANGVVAQPLIRRTGLYMNGGRVAFALPGSHIDETGWHSGSGAYFRPGSDEAKIDLSAFADASEDQIRDAVRSYILGHEQYVPQGRAWYWAEIGLAGWVHRGPRPRGSFMVIGVPGSGKSTGSRLHNSSYGPRYPRTVIFGRSLAQIADTGHDLHNVVVRPDDYKPNPNERKDVEACDGLEILGRRGYEEAAGRVGKVHDDTAANGWSQGSARLNTPGFALGGERVPTTWTRSTYERVMMIHHEHGYYIEGGAREIKRLTSSGCAALTTGRYLQHVVAEIAASGLSLEQWISSENESIDDLAEVLGRRDGWDVRDGEVVGQLILGARHMLEMALEIGALDEREFERLSAESEQALISAMQAHIERYLPPAEDPWDRFRAEFVTAVLRGEMNVYGDGDSYGSRMAGVRHTDAAGNEWVCLDLDAVRAGLEAIGVTYDRRDLLDVFRSRCRTQTRVVKGVERQQWTFTVRTARLGSGSSTASLYWFRPADLFPEDEADE